MKKEVKAVTKSEFLAAFEKHFAIEDIAKELGISVVKVREGAKAFSVNLRKKSSIKFIDDTNTENSISSGAYVLTADSNTYDKITETKSEEPSFKSTLVSDFTEKKEESNDLIL